MRPQPKEITMHRPTPNKSNRERTGLPVGVLRGCPNGRSGLWAALFVVMLCLITPGSIDAAAKDSFAFKEKVAGGWASSGEGPFSIKAKVSTTADDHFDPATLTSNTLVIISFGEIDTTNTFGADPTYVDGATSVRLPLTYLYWHNNQWNTGTQGTITLTMSTRGVKLTVLGSSNGWPDSPILGGVHEFDIYGGTYSYAAIAHISVGDLSREMTIAITDKVKVKPEGVDPWIYQVIYKVSIKGKLVTFGP